jgi:DNA-directed RNA polymerase specialized sigma24 family protein
VYGDYSERGGRMKMTKDKLEQFTNLKREIDYINKKISVLESKDIPEARDVVKASSKDWPYIEGRVSVEGYDESANIKRSRSVERLRVVLKNRLNSARQTEAEIEEFIAGIRDSRTRMMFQYRYIDSLTYEKIGDMMHCDRTTVERTIDRYLKNN